MFPYCAIEQTSNSKPRRGPMTLPTTITPAILDTVLGHLAPHFLASAQNDAPTARHAASQMLAAYNAETEDELHLAADIVSFGFHALEALSEAAAPDLSLNNKLRLRGSAVSLSREAHKARRKLDQLQRARRAAPQPQTRATTEPRAATEPDTETDQARALVELARETIKASNLNGAKGWTLSRDQRRAAERSIAKFNRNHAEQIRRDALKAASTATTQVQHATM